MTIKESFALIRRKQEELGYYFLKVLRQPADTIAIESAEKQFGFEFNDELKELYSCADGVENDYNTASGLLGLIPIHIFLRLKDSFEYYKTHIIFEESFANYKTNFKPDKNLFPFLEDGAGNCYWIDLNRGTENYGKVFWTNTFGEDPNYIYISLTSFFNVISECYDKRIFFLDENGYLDSNFEKFESISKFHNNKLNYWKNK